MSIKVKKLFFLSIVILVPCILIAWLVFASPASAVEVPQYLSFEGQLSDSSDELLTNTFDITFRIYKSLTGGSAIWTEIQSNVSVSNGYFRVSLGDTTALNLDFDEPYWISVEINSDGEMSPRTPINSVGYAFSSDVAFGAYTTTTAPSGAAGGDLYYDTDDSNLYLYNGTGWEDLASPSTTLFSITDTAYFGGTATSTFGSDGSLTVASNISSDANNTDDLGSFGMAWNNLFVSSTSFLNSVTTTQITPWANNTSDLGAYGSAWKDTFVSGTLYVGGAGATSTFANGLQSTYINLTGTSASSTFANGIVLTSGCIEQNGLCLTASSLGGATTALNNLASVAINTSLLSDAANTDDLGSFALPWKNIYASSTAYLNYVSSTAQDAGTILSGIWNGTAIGDTYLTKTGDWTGTIDGNNFTGGAVGLGDILYGSGAGTIAELLAGSNGYVLALESGIPAWVATSTLSDLGGATTALDNLASVAINTSLISDANNTDDLGSFGLAWNNLFVSSTAYLGGLSVSSTSNGYTELIPESANYLVIGDAGVASHSLNANDDLFVSGELEVNGTTYLDGDAVVNTAASLYFGAGTNALISFNTTQTPDSWNFGIPASSNAINFIERADNGFDFAHALQTNPTIFIQSANQSTNEYISFAHNQTDGIIGVGTGNIIASTTAFVGSANGSSNNATDLGAFSKAWQDVFASGTIYMVTSTIAANNGGTLTLYNNGTNSVIETGSGDLDFYDASAVRFRVSSAGNVAYSGLNISDDKALSMGNAGDATLYYRTEQTPDSLILGVSTDSNGFIISEKADVAFDFAHAQQTNPTIFIQSANQSTNEYISFAHNQTDGIIGVGTGNIIASTTAFVGNANGSSNNATDLGAYGSAWKDLFVSGTTYLGATALNGDFDPSANNTYDLGEFGLAWNNLFVSSTSYIGGLSVSSTSNGYTELIPESANYLVIGDAGVTSHTLDANDDLLVSGELEVNGVAYFDSNLRMLTDRPIYMGSGGNSTLFYGAAQTPDSLIVGEPATSNAVIFAENGDINFDFAHALQTNPTIFIQSANQSTNEYISFAHNQTDGVIGVGTGNIIASTTAFVGSANGSSNNATDLGAYGSAWNNLFVSSTAYLDYVSSTALNLANNLTLTGSTTDSNTGIIYKGENRFIHNFSHPTGNTAVPDGFNLFIGEQAGNFTMGSTASAVFHASENVGIGRQTFLNNTIGFYNTAVGNNALKANTSGSSNMALGRDALTSNTTGADNASVGRLSLFSNTTGGQNIAIGRDALYSNTTGATNIGIGYQAGKFIANGSSANQLTSTSLYIGGLTKSSVSGAYNENVIGYNATGLGSRTITLGDDTITKVANFGNNTADLGGYGNAWNNVFASGTLHTNAIEIGRTGVVGSITAPLTITIDSTGNIVLFPDGEQLRFGTGSDASFYYNSNQDPDVLYMGVGADSNGLVVAQRADSSFDFAHALETNPTIFIHSANQNANEYLSFAHDQTNGRIGVGVGNITVSSTALVPDVNNLRDLGVYGNAWKDLFVSGTTYLGATALNGDFDPSTNNTYDLGEFGLAWNNLFVSSTAYVGGLSVSSTSNGYTELIPESANYLVIGDAGVTSHTLNANDDLLVSGELEVNGSSWFDGNALFAGTTGVKADTYFSWNSTAYPLTVTESFGNQTDTVLMLLGATDNSYIFGPDSMLNNDFDHGAQTNPTVFIHSDTDPDTNNAQYLSFTHNQTDGVISVGTGQINMGSNTYFDTGGILSFGDNQDFGMKFSGDQEADAMVVGLNDASNNIIFTNRSILDNFYNHGHVASANPTIFVHSDNQVTNEYLSFAHNQTDGVIGVGTGNIIASTTAFVGNANGSSNNATDLGAYGSAWKDIFASGTLYLNGDITMPVGSRITLDNDGATPNTEYIIGQDGSVDIYAGGAQQLQIASGQMIFRGAGGTFRPSANNAQNLGIFGVAWKNLYVSSTSYLNYVSSTAMDLTGSSTLRLTASTTDAVTGVIYKGDDSFIHNFMNTVGISGGGGPIPDGHNLFFGLNAGNFTLASSPNLSTDGSYNIGIGDSTLTSLNTGGANIAIGHQALYLNATGNSNTAIGDKVLYTNVSGANNTATGYRALYSNTGSSNSATGYQALYSNTSGGNNTAVGQSALFNNLVSSANTAVGYGTLYTNTGKNNTAVGDEALYYNSSGNYNTALGMLALQRQTVGGGNVAIGYNAGRFLANGTSNNTIASSSIMIGAETKALSNTGDNEVVIGYSATGKGSNTLVLGNNDITDSWLVGSTSIIASTTAFVGNKNGSSNNVVDLGAYGSAWKNVFASSTAHLGYVSSTAMDLDKLSLDGKITFNGPDAFISPATNNTGVLGSYGSAWRNLYVSSTSFIGGLSVSSTVKGYTELLPEVDDTDNPGSGYIMIGNAGVANKVNLSGADDELFVSGELEVNGATWLDGQLVTAGAVQLATVGSEGNTYVCTDTNGTLSSRTDDTCTSSALRYKENIQDHIFDMDAFLQNNVVNYDWIVNGEEDVGMIAEEVLENNPELVFYNDDGEIEGIKNNDVMWYTFEVVKAQQAKIGELEATLNTLVLNGDWENISSQSLEDQLSGLFVEFEGDILVKGHAIFNGDTVGQGKILVGDTEVKIEFEKEYEYQPIVNISNSAKVDGDYWISTTTVNSFYIVLEKPQLIDLVFNWHAFGSDNGKISISDGTVEDIEIIADLVEPSLPPVVSPSPPPSPPEDPPQDEPIVDETSSDEPPVEDISTEESPPEEEPILEEEPSPPDSPAEESILEEPPAEEPILDEPPVEEEPILEEDPSLSDSPPLDEPSPDEPPVNE